MDRRGAEIDLPYKEWGCAKTSRGALTIKYRNSARLKKPSLMQVYNPTKIENHHTCDY